MEMVTVSAAALESIKAMAAKVQAERDELLEIVKVVMDVGVPSDVYDRCKIAVENAIKA